MLKSSDKIGHHMHFICQNVLLQQVCPNYLLHISWNYSELLALYPALPRK